MISKKLMMASVATLAVLSLCLGLCVVTEDSDNSDANATTNYGTVQLTVGESYTYYLSQSGSSPSTSFGNNTYSSISGIPDGMSVSKVTQSATVVYYKLSGTPTTSGTYNATLVQGGSLYDNIVITFVVSNTTAVVTYNAGIGTVGGSSTYSETITINSFASLPAATYSTGAYSFLGWATSSTSSTVVSSYTVTSNVTLYAVWFHNSTSISSYSATVTQGQSLNNTFSTNPSGSSVSITSYGGLSGQVSMSGKTLSGVITAAPGTYFIVLQATYSGYISSSVTVTITVPVTITPPIEYTLVEGQTFSYEPVTNPSSATISLTSVTLDGTSVTNSGLSVSGRTITGVLATAGTYAVTFSASASGYVAVSKTVYIYVSEPTTDPVDPVSISSISATARANDSRVYDFIAVGVSNAVNYSWFVGDVQYSSSSSTSLYEFSTSGIYTVKCVVTGSDSSTAYTTVNVICLDTYHKEMAWSGVEYNFIQAVSGTEPAVTISGGSSISYAFQTVGSNEYLVISGTPSSSEIGNTYTVAIGTDSYSIEVYQGQSSAPVSSFIYEIGEDGYTVNVTSMCENASVVLYDYYGNGEYTTSTTCTYTVADYYTISCMAVNNISERTSSQLVEIGIVETITVDIGDLTDTEGYVNEQLIITVSLAEGESLAISGSAAEWMSVDGDKVYGKTSTAGEYVLDVVLTHSDSTTVSKTIKVIIKDQAEDQNGGFVLGTWVWIVALVLFFVMGAIIFAPSKKNGKIAIPKGKVKR